MSNRTATVPAEASRDARGHEQAGARYAVVLQSDDLPLST
jgi:mRNA interferase MazF